MSEISNSLSSQHLEISTYTADTVCTQYRVDTKCDYDFFDQIKATKLDTERKKRADFHTDFSFIMNNIVTLAMRFLFV